MFHLCNQRRKNTSLKDTNRKGEVINPDMRKKNTLGENVHHNKIPFK